MAERITVAIMREPGQYEDRIRYEFETVDEARQFVKTMRGVLVCDDFHIEEK